MGPITDKKLKAMYISVACIVALTWVVTIVFLIFLPDIVPLHTSGHGYDRYGSKLEWLMLPAVSTFMGCFFYAVAYFSKKKSEKTVEWVALWAGIIILTGWLVMWSFSMATGFYQ